MSLNQNIFENESSKQSIIDKVSRKVTSKAKNTNSIKTKKIKDYKFDCANF